MNSSKQKKSKTSQLDDDNQPYHHPVLEEQMIIRFPVDIAVRLSGDMDMVRGRDEGNPTAFQNFEIKFVDPRHAKVSLYDEIFDAVLVDLPTIVETHRTVDGSHLFKSADIGQMLIVYRPSSAPTTICDDFVYEHGLTKPTANIVSKRKAKQDYAKSQQSESQALIEGIEYTEMVEIQLQALIAKDRNSMKPIVRQEFLEEPEVDPVLLEKILRRKLGPQFKGYSGKSIPDDEIEDLSTENEPVVHIPQDILEEITKDTKKEEDEEEDEFQDLLSSMTTEEEEIQPQPSPVDAPEPEPKDEEEDGGEEEEDDDDDDEDSDNDTALRLIDELKLRERLLNNNITKATQELAEIRKESDSALRETREQKTQDRINKIKETLKSTQSQRMELEAQVAAKQ